MDKRKMNKISKSQIKTNEVIKFSRPGDPKILVNTNLC